MKETYNLINSTDRDEYFRQKAGTEISDIKKYLDNDNGGFLAFLISPKAGGKGTKTGYLVDIFGEDKIKVISVGDLIRDLNKLLESEDAKEINKVRQQISENFRSTLSVDDAFDTVLNREQVTDKVAIPTELIITLLKNELVKPEYEGKGVFIDGFPRSLEQINLSLYFKDIMNFQDNTDFAVLIDAPNEVIKSRLEGRLICQTCNISRNLTLLPTKFVEFNEDNQKYELKCDKESCSGYEKETLVEKEGDSEGFKRIESRVITDKKLMEKIREIHGLPVIEVPNSVKKDKANEYQDYELTPEYVYSLDKNGNTIIETRPLILQDDNGNEIYMLESPPTVIPLIKGMHRILIN